MQGKFIDSRFPYTGAELRSLYAYLEHGILGDSVVSWIGPCEVKPSEMIDGEDLKSGSRILGGEMLHFVIEKFHQSLFAGVCLQRLLASICLDMICEMRPELAVRLRRDGDDIYFEDQKLSISIATVSPVSALIHFAVNCTNTGTPEEVKTCALVDFDINPQTFALELMRRLIDECHGIDQATVKVKWAK